MRCGRGGPAFATPCCVAASAARARAAAPSGAPVSLVPAEPDWEARAAAALAHWTLPQPPLPLTEGGGLINRTWQVGAPPAAALQWLNPIFPPAVNADIQRLSDRLRAHGVPCPELLPTRGGARWVEADGGAWRALSWIPGRTLHQVSTPALAEAAGAVLGRFHAALDGWAPERSAPIRRIHDTPARLAELARAVAEGQGHRLHADVEHLAEQILSDWSTWDGSLALPERICHGDPKISNIRFHPDLDLGICLIDLDTVGPQTLDCELGDAWRLWCNPSGEDDPEAVSLDLERFSAAATGFLRAAPPLQPEEREGIAGGLERICLELASRFAADALRNSYFREDRVRWPAAGDHNLRRARGQHRLARLARAHRAEIRAILRAAAGP